MFSIGVFGAFVAGIFSLISPCSALLLPAFFAYAFSSWRALIRQTAVFFAGLCMTLIPVGVGLAGVLAQHRTHLIVVGGFLLIALGVFSALGGGFRLPGIEKLQGRIQRSSDRRGATSALSIFMLGLVYGFAGFCAGPLLGAVLTTAAVSGSVVYGALIMFAYALGMALPLFVLAAGWDKLNIGQLSWLRGHPLRLGFIQTNTMNLFSGVLFVLIGVVFIRSHGASELPAVLNIDQQFSVQTWVSQHFAQIPDAWVWCVLSLVATVLVGIKAARTPVSQD